MDKEMAKMCNFFSFFVGAIIGVLLYLVHGFSQKKFQPKARL